MKLQRTGVLSTLFAALFLFAPTLTAEEVFHAIEINGVLCGYVETSVSDTEVQGLPTTLVEQKVFAMLSALGSRFNTEVNVALHFDPETGRCRYTQADILQADIELDVRVWIEGNTARIDGLLDDKVRTIELPEGIVIENPLEAPHLVRDFVVRGARSVTYQVLEPPEVSVNAMTYTWVDEEPVELVGREIETLVLDRLNEVTGLTSRHWIDVETGMSVVVDAPGGRHIYLADSSVKKRIELANLDETIATRTNESIGDVQAISYMRVRAVLEPIGLRFSGPEDLNVPGQRFAGTVVGNRIEGVFTIEHLRYDGAGAPSFPPDPGHADYPWADAAFRAVLEDDERLESDDPVLIAHARRVTAGASDAWQAATRLSRWVAQNIDYAIPGGGTARRTFDMRAGECGAHSILLASLCRAAGIPARVVWGCMYTQSFGGSFGQHGWNEVHMGEAGWIPVDSTAYEADFVDSGHIRVGTLQSMSTAVNTQEAEILEYRLLEPPAAEPEGLVRFEELLGRYEYPGRDEPFEVRVSGDALTLNIPGQTLLALNDADDEGRFYAKLKDRLYCTFARDAAGEVTALEIHQIVPMLRTGEPVEMADDVPPKLQPFLGVYRLAQMRADFEVVYDEGGFGVYHPMLERVLYLLPTGEPGRWIDDTGGRVIWFELGEGGRVRALVFDSKSRFERIDSESMENES